MNEQINALMTGAAVKALELTGNASPLVSFHKAKQLYGAWFVRETKLGRIKPAVEGGKGTNVVRQYRTSDILARLSELAEE